MSKKEKIQTVSWKDIHLVETDDGREVYYFVSPKLEVIYGRGHFKCGINDM